MPDGETPEGAPGIEAGGLEDPRAPWEQDVEDPAAPRALLAVMFTDIVGSTELATTLGDKRWRELLEQHDAAVREQIARFEGREVDTAGDAFFATFGRPIQAVDCALESARAVRRLGLRIRAGIHMGECVVTADKVRGVTVHIGARVGAKAKGDEVLVSGTVRDTLIGQGITFDDRGEQTLKGVEGKWRLYAVEPRVRDNEADLPPLLEPAAPPTIPLWKRRRVQLAAATALVLAIGATTFAVTREGGLSSVPADSVAVIDAGSGRITSSVAVGRRPTGLAVSGGDVWVANSIDRTISRVTADGSRDNIGPLGVSPSNVVASPNLIWIGNEDDGTVTRVDARTKSVVGEPTRTGNGLSGIAFGAGALWAANGIDGTVVRVDPASGKITGTFKVGPALRGILATSDAVWTASEASGTVSRIDPTSGSVVGVIPVGNGPRSLALGSGSLWVANAFDGTVSRVDAGTDSVTAVVRVGRDPRAIATAGGRVFVANESDATISVIDPDGNRVVRTIALKNAPMGLAADGDRVWVSVRGGILNYRGGTLRFGSAFDEDGFRTLDPMQAWNPVGFAITTSVYDGLLAYKRAGGVEGSVLVPNLVERILPPTDGGKTYSFRLRPGVRFSSGAKLKASDVRKSFERMFRIEAQATVFFAAIVGTESCTTEACDLSRGIITDDEAGTIIFHLRTPVPDFPYFLGHPLAAMLPGDTPLETPPYTALIGTGPYAIADVKTGELNENEVAVSGELTLERNMHFRSRGAAQPDGYPDRIIVTWGGTPEENLAAVKAGRLDWSINAVDGAPNIEDVLNEVPGQFHVFHQESVLFTTLNPNIPPTNDPRVRRAINLAVDRAAMAEVVGAPIRATVACQLLAPGVFGYVPYCPYTKNAGRAGIWSGPDLTEARRLVAESGTRGQRITLWTDPFHPWRPVIELLADAMSKIGFRPVIRFRDGGQIFETALDSPTGYQVMVSGWFADLPAASNFVLPTFACPQLADRIIGRPDSSANVAWFCDRGVDAKIEAAIAAQEKDILSAADLWTAVDRAITDAAPFVPYATLLNATLVSSRVGNIQSNPLTGVLLTQMWLTDRK
jgi:YVTN family beta-propeller protein